MKIEIGIHDIFERSFEILELKQGATLDDVRQAYKDIVQMFGIRIAFLQIRA